MSSLNQIIDNTQTLQDIELASAIQQLKANPGAFTQWLQTQEDNVYKNIVGQKQDTFERVYGELNRASKVEESILMHNKRATELSALVNSVYSSQEASATSVVKDKELAYRKREMNEWSVGNKQDTLFVYSSMFIMLSGLLLITTLWRMSLISSYLWVAFAVPFILIFILIFIRRWRYTEVLRNKRHWNKQIFEGKYAKIAVPSCPDIMGGVDSVVGGAASAMGGAASAMGGAASAMGGSSAQP